MRLEYRSIRWTAIAALLLLAACGGGSADAPTASTHQLAMASQRKFESIDMDASSPASEVDSSISAPKQDMKHSLRASPPLAADEDLLPPDACKRMYFGNLGLQCMLSGSGVEPYAGGSGVDDIAPANPWCVEIPVGVVVQGTTPLPGDFACYQFVINALTPVTVQAALPTSLLATAELYAAMPNGIGFKYSSGQPMGTGVNCSIWAST